VNLKYILIINNYQVHRIGSIPYKKMGASGLGQHNGEPVCYRLCVHHKNDTPTQMQLMCHKCASFLCEGEVKIHENPCFMPLLPYKVDNQILVCIECQEKERG